MQASSNPVARASPPAARTKARIVRSFEAPERAIGGDAITVAPGLIGQPGARVTREAAKRREYDAAIKRLQAEHKRLQDRIHAMYVDKLDGLIDAEFFELTSSGWREEQARCQRQIELHQAADRSYLDEGVQLLELARSAQSLFSRQEPREKRRLLNFVLSNCVWQDGTIAAEFRQPFALLAETNGEAAALSGTLAGSPAKREIWLGN